MRKIKIFDTTLRDGEQSPGCTMNLAEKLEMAAELDKLCNEIEQYRNNLERELKEQEDEKQRNIEKIKNQNWYIQETTPKYEKLKIDFNKLIERYKNGTKICENLFQEAKKKWPDEIKKLEENINNHKSELLLLDERYNKKLNVITKMDNEIKDKERESQNGSVLS